MEGLTSPFTRSASLPRPLCLSRAASVLREAVNSANGSLNNASTAPSSLRFVSLTLRSSFVSCFPLFFAIHIVSHCFRKTQRTNGTQKTKRQRNYYENSLLLAIR